MKQRIAAKLVSIASKPGPKTEAGKNKVKGNSYVHGLTAQHLIIEAIDQPDYDRAAENFRLRFRPADGFEHELLQRIIDTNWRLNICASVESGMLSNVSVGRWDRQIDAKQIDAKQIDGKPDKTTRDTFLSRRARTFTEQANAIGILGRYEAGLHRRFVSMLRELEAAIANRPEPLDQISVEPIDQTSPGPIELTAAQEPAKPLVMTAAACSHPEQNNPQTTESDSFRRSPESGQTPRSSNESEREGTVAAYANPDEKALSFRRGE
jgi:hypothetical protein